MRYIAPLVLATTLAVTLHAGPLGIARLTDPPPPVDGSLERLAAVPGSLSWERAEQVVYGVEKWLGPSDMSGRLFLGWDANFLYIGAMIADDVVVQPYFGANIYRGDHLEVFLDVPRHDPASRSGRDIYQIGLSPGNFAAGEAEIAPEIVQWSPKPGTVTGARIAARRTDQGYQIEAALPWKAFALDAAAEGLLIGIDVTLSDADMPMEPGQESMASLLSDSWSLRDPARMLEAALANADGSVDPALLRPAFAPFAENLRVSSGGSLQVDLTAVDTQPAKELILQARIDYPKLAGGSQCLTVELNGTPLDQERVRNRLRRFTMGTSDLSSYSHAGWFLFYAPDFSPAPAGSSYAVKDIHPYELRFDVSDLWKASGNQLLLRHSQPKISAPIAAAVAISDTLSEKYLPPTPKPAPTGPIPTFVPEAPATPDYTASPQADGSLNVTLGRHRWNLQSRFSTTEPGWTRLSAGGIAVDTPHYRVRRSISRQADHLRIHDRISNTSDVDQPVMIRYELDAGEGLEQVYVAGRHIETPRYQTSQGAHPVSLALLEDAGIALVSEDDVMRAQAVNGRHGSVITIHNNRLVVAQNSSVDLEISIYPLETPDPFALINRIRRNWDTNFTIDGSFAFMKQRAPVSTMSDAEFTAHLQAKQARFICSSLGRYNGAAAHGTAFAHTDHSSENLLFERARRCVPGTQTLFYYHCFISVLETDPETFAADILRRPDGSHADYRNSMYPLFLPRLGSAFAQAQDALIDMRFEKLDLDGIYWDEIAYSAYMYDYSDAWDGYSADIDPQTHRISRKIANVTLATLSWRLQAVEKLMARGLLIGNGAPLTRTFTRLHFPRFIETGSMSNLTRGQLYTPIALGDHLTERTPQDCYRNMLGSLDYGALYYWYSDQIVAAEPTLTSVMFPATPIALGPGFIIARERILTNRSGLFGWNDDSDFETVVFDSQGRRTTAIAIPKVTKDGKTYAEVRIPEGVGVAIIRR